MAEGAVWPMIVAVLLERFESRHRPFSASSSVVTGRASSSITPD